MEATRDFVGDGDPTTAVPVEERRRDLAEVDRPRREARRAAGDERRAKTAHTVGYELDAELGERVDRIKERDELVRVRPLSVKTPHTQEHTRDRRGRVP